MERQPVESSMLRSVGYDETEQVLELEFQSGEVWQYLGVPKSEFAALMNASSHGSYARGNIIGVYGERMVSRKRRR